MMAGLALEFGLIVNAFFEVWTVICTLAIGVFAVFKKNLTNDYKVQKIMECSIKHSDGLLT